MASLIAGIQNRAASERWRCFLPCLCTFTATDSSAVQYVAARLTRRSARRLLSNDAASSLRKASYACLLSLGAEALDDQDNDADAACAVKEGEQAGASGGSRDIVKSRSSRASHAGFACSRVLQLTCRSSAPSQGVKATKEEVPDEGASRHQPREQPRRRRALFKPSHTCFSRLVSKQ